jgi:redox-sensitive bicupin YhaK (pirin superfamily)
VAGPNFDATVIVGEFASVRSPARIHSPLVAAEIVTSGTEPVELTLDPEFEHALLVLDGELRVGDVPLTAGPLGYLGAGRSALVVEATHGSRFMLLGGEPFTEELLMWWNFVGRTHDEIQQARTDWENEADQLRPGRRFGIVAPHAPHSATEAGRIPAPPLPTVRLTARRRA